MTLSASEGGSSLTKGGPASQEGKEIVRCNADRHGIRSRAPVVPGIEKKEDWKVHAEGVLESLKPVGHLETVLAERVALLSWNEKVLPSGRPVFVFGGDPDHHLSPLHRRGFGDRPEAPSPRAVLHAQLDVLPRVGDTGRALQERQPPPHGRAS